MNNFFETVLDHATADSDKDLVANALSAFDNDRVFPCRDTDSETLAAEYRISQSKKNLRVSLRDQILAAARKRFENARGKGAPFNVEDVIDSAYKKRSGSSYRSILYLINWMLTHYDSKIEALADQVYHSVFDSFVNGVLDCRITSMNYDILLDRSLVRWLRKKGEVTEKDICQLLTGNNSVDGILDPLELPTNVMTRSGSFPDPPAPRGVDIYGTGVADKIKLLKPHGSISFWKRESDDINKECYLLLENDESGQFNFGSFHEGLTQILDTEGPDRMPLIQPLIVPPTSTKVKSYPILFEAERSFLEWIGRPGIEKILIVGWSLPPTDDEHAMAIRFKILERSPQHQIEELIVIDATNDENHYDKFEALLQPKRIKKGMKGFTLNEVHKLL